MTKNTVTALRWVPPFAQGLVRDLRVRWALEEAGLEYQARLIDREDQQSHDYRELQPFGQVPAFVEGDLVLFESGAVVMHIAEQTPALMPAAADDRARVKTWMFAALNTIEPPIMMLNVIDMQEASVAAAAKELRGNILKFIQIRLDALAEFLGEREFLIADRFTAADLLMVSVLRILRTTDLVTRMKTLDAYRLRGEARPAFKQALGAQLDAFEANAPKT